MSAPDINRVRDMYSWATGWRPDVLPDQPHMADVQATLRAEFDAALAAHDAEKHDMAERWKAVANSADDLLRAVMDALNIRPDQDPVIEARRIAAVLAEQGETEWEGTVLGREVGGSGDWSVTAWRPDEIEEARAMFPGSEYVLGRAKWLPVPDTTNERGE